MTSLDFLGEGASLTRPPAFNDTDDSESESDEELEIGMLVRKFKKFLKKKGSQSRKPQNSKTKGFSKSDTSDSNVITCYECGKTGHIRSECYKLQNKAKPVKTKGKDQQPSTKRAYIAWNDNDEDSSGDSEDEEANLCLMANTDSESDSEESTTSNPSYDELHDAFNELHAEYICLASRNQSWYLDNGCSKHMTGDKSKFLSLDLKDGGFVKYGDNNKGKILCIGDIGSNSTV
uniref:Uncharacterized protein LOC113784373 n=1 Tax=Cicer arietinum TaxID=3827 RepID=A0A3Q7YB81_CICAR|nr:uncharacterized protein LOC113784373 [Cicer arietinum]